VEWDIYAYELAREFGKFLSGEFLAFIKEELGMPNALQVEEFAAGVVDNSGVPLAGGKVYTYAAGTTTDKATYTDAAMTTPEANPVILNGAGVKNVYAYGNYKFVIKDLNDVTIRTLDNQYFMIPSTTALVTNTITANYNATAVDQVIKGNTASGSITVYLPTAVGNEGCRITVIKISANNTLTLDANALYTQTINGAATVALGANWEAIEVVSDNANWVIINSNASASVTLTGTQTLTNKTLTAPVINGAVTGTITLPSAVGIVTLGGDWANVAAPVDCEDIQSTKSPDGIVTVQGVLTRTAGSVTTPFTLPAGHRPSSAMFIPVVKMTALDSDTALLVTGTILANGTVNLFAATTGHYYSFLITFKAA
jgi:hypothetical protein